MQSTPQPTALNAVGGRVFQRKARARARARASGTRGGSGPPGGMLVLPRGKSGWVREVPDPYGRSEASAVSSELPFLRDMWRLRTHPQAGNGSGAVGLVREEPGPWGLATLSFPRSYG